MFVFYDIESCSLDTKFGQILQIALVFTDDNMNPLASKKLECRRSPWIVPSPGALLVTGFTPDDLKKAPLSNYEMMQEVNDWLRAQHWPLVFSGFNTLGFDEDSLAANLDQNLLDPQVTTKVLAGGLRNGRFDISEVVKAVVAYMPGTLKLDRQNDRGYSSLSLKNIAQQNGIDLGDEDAHDAMNDVRATIGVAKLLKKAAPQIWDQMLQMARPDGVDSFIAAHEMFTHCYISYGKAKGAVVTGLGAPEGCAEKEILFDLSYAPEKYLSMTVDELKQVFIDQKKKVEKWEPLPPKPFRLIAKTRQPTLMPIELSDPVIPSNLTEEEALRRLDLLQSDSEFKKRLSVAVAAAEKESVVASRYDSAPEVQKTKVLDSVLEKKLSGWAREFYEAPNAAAKIALINAFDQRFKDEIAADPASRRYAKFAGRILFETAPQVLTAEKREQMMQYIAQRMFNPDLNAPYITLAKARNELAEIETERAQGKEKWKDVTDGEIRALKLYYTALEKEYAPFAPVQPPVNDNAQPAIDPVKPKINPAL